MGVGGDKAYDTLTRIQNTPIESRSLKCVLIHTGSNDAAKVRRDDAISDLIIDCVYEITKRNPHVNIIISCMLPRIEPTNKKLWTRC